ncbi:hypothetical protein [Paraburkholderia sp. BL10I2N1]|uniref:hypothetical protein n=1 Tax=Paraburkholderia sp. BL10I2N1 TaxID=1938796 RepID=UPI0010612FB8|nr:hypothetical protein [Paraburkholderia sp. BL10I2N1]TDN61193.1 hypothetical protein B0G77_4630 [Paraburkholderia sp. BL10I2N1]
MKALPIIALFAAASACAQAPGGVQIVGQSHQAAEPVAFCIAKKWADASQKEVILQTIVANNLAMDVYVPGQAPPSGDAAMVRPGTSVGFRSANPGASEATSSINACL